MYQFKELKDTNMIVEIFKTNVQKESDRDYVVAVIQNQFPDYKINFDLEDCDKILRIEGVDLQCDSVIDYVSRLGYVCVKID
ncbi:MAG: hypothetical protein REI96_04145 [Flavobacterium nitrogenifigens]|uniref:hypothetical protein n=1 Tax=Flavobacterium nitrogenifigens TaxID=1617283 RepID=UPI0028074A7E|nr:hypothetical protein [Flavobacterium nitrogenifigens]MDQ8011615.1 hypothetical protein [Flavobacterium nitrogenifigens]